ncbi:isoprenoid synthase domain-containing protein [Aspergillus cavernicola]|uniref:Terpene synthase n=1 Tax=Aspergillus cavernicola TaxID=176166 RepID=A0ABR4J1Q6_9EURO
MATSHETFRESLQGQTVTIPNIYHLLPEWKPRMHDEYQRARDKALNPWIERWVDDKRTAQKLKSADFGVFAAVWGASASFDVLCTAAKYFAWYFVYDDIFDCGALKHNTDVLQAYREASLQYFKFILIDEGEFPDLSIFDTELQKGLRCWDEVGQHIQEVCSKETREILCDEMLRYVGSLDNVDSIFSDHGVPSLDQYWDRREATAGVYCVIATLPFIYGVDVTREDVQVQSMKDLWKHTSYFVHITNDMFSMRKEINDGQIENLIPVLMLNRKIDCNTAMQQSYALAHNEAMGLQNVDLNLCNGSEERSKAVSQAFIRGCQDVAMGLAHWSYSGHRYVKPWERDDNGAISFTVGMPKSQSKAVGFARGLDIASNHFRLLRRPLHDLFLNLVQFSPLIMLMTMSTMSALAPRSGISLHLFPPNWMGRLKQLA